MANEFITKNGFISLKNSQVSGSLTVTNGITASLSGTASNATTASFALSTPAPSSASFATTASFSFNATSASYVSGGVATHTALVINTVNTSSQAITINSSGSVYTIGNGNWANFPVPFFRSAVSTSIALDVMPGGPQNTASIDISDTDVFANNASNYETLHLVKNPADVAIIATHAKGTGQVRSLVFQDTSGSIGFNVVPTEQYHAKFDQNARTTLVVENASTGSTANVSIEARNSTVNSDYLRIVTTGKGFGTNGGFTQNGGALELGTTMTGSLSIIARSTGSSIVFYTNGFATGNERLRIVPGGSIGVGGITNPVNMFDVNGNISCSVITASLFGTSSFSTNARTASFTTSASFATSASWAPNQFALSTGSTYPITSSWATNALTASISTTASYASASTSASFAITSSEALYAKTSFVEDINNGLIVYLPFDEGTGSIIRNYSSYGVDATKMEAANGSASVATGSGWSNVTKRGGYSQLLTPNTNTSGSASYVEFNNSTIAAGLPSMSFAIWYQSSGSTVGVNGGRIVTKFNGSTSGEFSYTLTNANSIGVILVNSSNQRLDQTATTPKLNDNKWHHIVGTYDGSTSSVYVDGKLCSAVAFTGSLQNSAFKLRVGTFENIGLSPLCGYVDEFKLWGRPLSANEILYLYNDGNLENGTYTDANGNNTISGSTTFLAGITASLQGTASFSTTASFSVSASLASAINFTPTSATSASYASRSLNSDTASYLNIANYYTASGLYVQGTNQVSSIGRIGSLEFEPFSTANNFLLMENLYYSSSGFVYRTTGFGSVIQFVNGEMRIGSQPSGSAGVTGSWASPTNPLTQIKTNFNGILGLGGNVSSTIGTFTGAALVLNGTSSLFQTPVTASVISASQFIGNASTSNTASLARQLGTGSSAIQYDSVQGIWFVNSPFEVISGIYDGANAVIAATFDDQHELFDSSGQGMIDFSGLGFGTLFGNWIVTGTITGSITNALRSTSSLSASTSLTSSFVLGTVTSASYSISSSKTVSASYASSSTQATILNTGNGTIVGASFGLNANANITCNSLYDAVNGVAAIVFNDDHQLNDAFGNASVDFSTRQLIGNWSGSLTGSFTGRVKANSQITITGDIDDVYLYNTQSAFFVTNSGSGVVVAMGNGICFADNGFQTQAMTGYTDLSKTPGTVAVWNSSFAYLSSSIVLISELNQLSGINTGSSIQSQLNGKLSTTETASWATNALTASIAQTISPSTYSALTTGSAVTWSVATNVYEDRKTILLKGATSMSISGLYNGWAGALEITNNSTASLLTIVPTPKVINNGGGIISLTTVSGSIDVIALRYNGTTLFASVGNNYT